MIRRLSIASALALATTILTVALSASTAFGALKDVSLTGGGSTFVLPLASTWTPSWDAMSGIGSVTYNGIGSGAGINAITGRSIDFGASDAPMTPYQQKLCNNAGGKTFKSQCLTMPWAFSGTAVAYHGTGLPNHLHVTGTVLAAIYLGQVKYWDSPRIASLNPGKSLPHLKITPIYRSDASGTSYNFTQYLSAVDSYWKLHIGTSTSPSWPAGQGAQKSSGVANLLKTTNGGIIYIDTAYTVKNSFYTFAVKNAAGKYVASTYASILAATASTKYVVTHVTGLILNVVNPPAAYPSAYPICTYTYVIMPTVSSKAVALKKILKWAMTKGQSLGEDLLFAPMPVNVQNAAVSVLNRVHT
ncbi:MAG: phosphate ABC transporter substrate-binding protein PstS [Gaiellaceae bacterium]|jgi:phosphate transport system substrate-binding protein